MLTTRTATSTTLAAGRALRPGRAGQTVVIVNGDSKAIEVLEPVLDAGNYNVVFVESSRHAYSQIRRTQPDLVILCLNLDDIDAFHVLSMLKLDEATRDIPVVTCTDHTSLSDDDADTEEDAPEEIGAPIFGTPEPTVLMN